jgi:carbonic anhydrase
MNPFVMLTSILAAIWLHHPQEKKDPPQQQQQKQSAAREAALAAIQGAKSVSEEKSVNENPPARKPETPTRVAPTASAGRTSAATGRASVPSSGSAGPSSSAATRGATATVVSDADKKASILFVANALLQQELAARREIISLADISTPEAALAELEAGNGRFVKGERVRTLFAVQDTELRTSLEGGQTPFAVIVGCSDSRAMESLVFDQELGRLFSIRAAGNVVDTLSVASIEYAVDHLGSKIVVVMGHTHCGAVDAVFHAGGEPLHENMHIFQDLMGGLLEEVPKDPNEADASYIARLEQENAKRQAKAIYERSKIVRELVDQYKIWLLPALYDLHSGQVTFFKPVGSPW